MASPGRIVATARGGPEVLAWEPLDPPEPASGQVRLRMQAAGVSAYDLMMRSHRLPGAPRPPFTPGLDMVGEVDRVGEGVTDVEAGQVVAVGPREAQGCYATHLCVPAEQVVAVPDGVDPVEAACLVTNYVTAWVMLHETAHVREGEQVLVQGAGGGVGTALLDLGREAGLELYGSASGGKHEAVKGFGAIPIDHRTEDVVARVRALTGDGVDVVFDPIGGMRQLWRSYRCLRDRGRLCWFGVAAIGSGGLPVIPATLLTRTALALWPDGRQAPMPDDVGEHPDVLAGLLDLLARGELSPVVGATVPLPQARRAHELLEEREVAGKVVLVAEE